MICCSCLTSVFIQVKQGEQLYCLISHIPLLVSRDYSNGRTNRLRIVRIWLNVSAELADEELEMSCLNRTIAISNFQHLATWLGRVAPFVEVPKKVSRVLMIYLLHMQITRHFVIFPTMGIQFWRFNLDSSLSTSRHLYDRCFVRCLSGMVRECRRNLIVTKMGTSYRSLGEGLTGRAIHDADVHQVR